MTPTRQTAVCCESWRVGVDRARERGVHEVPKWKHSRRSGESYHSLPQIVADNKSLHVGLSLITYNQWSSVSEKRCYYFKGVLCLPTYLPLTLSFSTGAQRWKCADTREMFKGKGYYTGYCTTHENANRCCGLHYVRNCEHKITKRTICFKVSVNLPKYNLIANSPQ